MNSFQSPQFAAGGQANAILMGQAAEQPERVYRPLVESPRPQAGFPSPAADYVEQPLDLNELLVRNPPATFFARVCGYSLVDRAILNGDIVSVDRSIDPTFGKVVVATADGDIYIKELGKVNGRPALISRNEKHAHTYPPIILDEVQDYEIFGVVTGVVRTL